MKKIVKIFFTVFITIWITMVVITRKCIIEDNYKERCDDTWY